MFVQWLYDMRVNSTRLFLQCGGWNAFLCYLIIAKVYAVKTHYTVLHSSSYIHGLLVVLGLLCIL